MILPRLNHLPARHHDAILIGTGIAYSRQVSWIMVEARTMPYPNK